MSRTAFLDRDGTVNVKPPEDDYVTDPEGLVLLPGAARAVAELNAAEMLVVLVTNQRGVARGLMTLADLDAVHAQLRASLAQEGAHLDAILVCPHERDTCACRKPEPGLLLEAARTVPGVELANAALVGDAPSDIEAAHRAGVPAVRIGTDVDSLAAAVPWLIHAPGRAELSGDVVNPGQDD